MGILKHLKSGDETLLPPRCLVGRASTSTLRMDAGAVSREHATLAWTGSGWEIRDLHSRNGTFVDGRRLDPGERALLEPGTEIVFGRDPNRYVLTDTAAPRAWAEGPDGVRVLAEDGILALPSADDPELTVYQGAAGQWRAEGPSADVRVRDQDLVTVAGGSWRLILPLIVEETVEVVEQPELSEGSLTFKVSLDEEHVECFLTLGSRTYELASRAHSYLLLTLARMRLADREAGELSEAECGWVHQEDIAEQLRVDRSTINVHVCRARRQFGAEGIRGAPGIVERRAQAGQLRIGIGDLHVERF